MYTFVSEYISAFWSFNNIAHSSSPLLCCARVFAFPLSQRTGPLGPLRVPWTVNADDPGDRKIRPESTPRPLATTARALQRPLATTARSPQRPHRDPDADPVRDSRDELKPRATSRKPSRTVGIKPDITDATARLITGGGTRRTLDDDSPLERGRQRNAPPVRDTGRHADPSVSSPTSQTHDSPLDRGRQRTLITPDADPETTARRLQPRDDDRDDLFFSSSVITSADMLTPSILRTLNGPIPTPFTGDLTHAAQFLQELDSLVWKNPDHPLFSTPWMRIDTALAFISGPVTLTWKYNIQRSRSPEIATDTLWDDFLESFCEAWVYSPEPTISVVAPTVQTSTADISSSSLAAVSTLKRVDDISIVLTKNELPPRHLSETIDQTADEDETDDRSSFAPCTSAPPPISPSSSPFDRASPINEPPRAPFQTRGQTVPVTTHDESSNLPPTVTLDLSTIVSTAQHPVAAPVKIDDGEILAIPPHASDGTTRKREHSYEAEDEHAYPRKHPRTQLARRCRPLPRQYRYVRQPITLPPPVDDSSGPFAPVRLYQSSPSVRLTTPRRAVLHDAISLRLPSRSFPAAIDPAADINDAADAVLFPSRPPSPSLAPALPSAHLPASIVEDDNSPRGGIKPLDASGFNPIHATSPPRTPRDLRYTDIFPRHAFEMPRDPDEVTPAASITPRNHAVPDDTTAQRPLRATATDFVPRPPVMGPTQTHNVRIALQHRIPTIDASFTRAATRISHIQSTDPHHRANLTTASPRPSIPAPVAQHETTTSTPWIQRPIRPNVAEFPPHPDLPRHQHMRLTQIHDDRLALHQHANIVDPHARRIATPTNRPVSHLIRAAIRFYEWLTHVNYNPTPRPEPRTTNLVPPHTTRTNPQHRHPHQTRNRVPDRQTDNPYFTDLNHTYEYDVNYDDDFT
ncbi:hypothetical protein EDB85DRAFT_2278728 [Lactarius pseudohatsudake]|nr:hypothetical protein EDB85DRAFT_2278728 [Lactarius pseudohatsudake]